MGPDGGYRLEAGNDMPPLLFDDDQALSVAIALRTAPALGAGIGEAAVRALATMRQVLPSRLRHRLDAVEVTTVGRPGEAPVAAVPLDVLLTLAQAVRDRVTLRFDYLPRGEDDPQPRRVEPHHLVTSQGRRRLRLRPFQGIECQRVAVPWNGRPARARASRPALRG